MNQTFKEFCSAIVMLILTVPIGYFLRLAMLYSDGITSFNLISCVVTGFGTAFIAAAMTNFLLRALHTRRGHIYAGILLIPFLGIGFFSLWMYSTLELFLASFATLGLVGGFFLYPRISRGSD